jgi:SOS-response transcriptional repressor LexA
MQTDHRAELASIKRFDQLIAYLRDEMGWPIARDSFEEVDDLFYDFTADELGIDPKTAAKIQEIKRLRPLSPKQPWGIFFVKFEPKRLPVVALRRILGKVALKKRASANSAERAAWAADDLLFVSNYGEGDERQISFAHFARAQDGHDLPTLKVLGWDNRDTALHLDAVARELTAHLAWPEEEANAEDWRSRWRSAFTMGHRETVTTSRDLSVRLAGLARDIRDRISTALAIETDKAPLTRLMNAFREALVHDLDPDGFADMYAQTIAYGLLSARIADPHRKTADDFAAHMRTNPFLRELMETFLKVGGRRGRAGGPGIDFDELGVSEVVDLLDHANMEAVVRDFGDRNPEEDPVIHFYELFLKEYDARKRMQRGVFYTPRPVVSYIVRSVDEVLRTEFGLADGLADTTTWAEMAKRNEGMAIPDGVSPDQDFVQILDPATGTGTFLVEVIDLIHKTLVSKWRAKGHGDKHIEELWNEYVPRHLLTRVHGYELLMAPYAIAHLKIGLKLYETGYRFGSDERARVYLTNALEPTQDFSGKLDFAIPALAHEASAVNRVKRDVRFVVVLGNPPYSKSSQNQGRWIVGLMEEYKRTVRSEETQIQALSDDYSKFLRFAQFAVESAGFGIVSYITNNSWLDGPLFRDMRSSMASFFHGVRILNLHGDSRKRFAPPDGQADENVFDIQQGVAINSLSRSPQPDSERRTWYEELWGTRDERYASLRKHKLFRNAGSLEPSPPHHLFVPVSQEMESEFNRFWHLHDVFGTGNRESDNHQCYGAGFVTQQDKFAVAHSIDELSKNVEAFLDSRNTDDSLWKRFEFCSTNQWNFGRAKRELKQLDVSRTARRCLYRPFDYRFTIFDRNVCTIVRKRITLQFADDNLGLLSTRRVTRLPYNNVFVCDTFAEYKVASHDRNTIVFPLWIYPIDEEQDGQLLDRTRRLNLSPRFLAAMARAMNRETAGDVGPAGATPESLFHYLYAVLHSPNYRSRYAEFLKVDFPRVPVTSSLDLFGALSRYGKVLSDLHLLRAESLDADVVDYVGGRLPPVEKVSWARDSVWLDGSQTVGFRGVPEEVWNVHIGGYRVCEKWLKDRKGRTLSKEDIAHYQKIVVALSQTTRLMKEIDEVIEQHGGWPGAFHVPTEVPRTEAGAQPRVGGATVVVHRPRVVEPRAEDRYVTCLPLVPLTAAAGAFSDPQHVQEDNVEWVEIRSGHRLRKGMFVAQVVGKSMEPAIPDGSYCLFRAPVDGSRQGKTVLVQLRDAIDPETGQRYTVKRYESQKAADGDSWTHERITLHPLNPDFAPIVLTDAGDGELTVIAEYLEGVEPPPSPDIHGPSGEGPEDVSEFKLRSQSRQPSLLGPQREADEEDDAGPPAPLDEEELPWRIRQLFADGVSLERDVAIRELREGLGFERTGPRLREALDNGLRTAVRRGILRNEGGELVKDADSIEGYDRAFLKTQFLASLGGRVWRDRDDAARGFARWLGFKRTGPVIDQTVRSLINGLLREQRLEARGSDIRRAE